MRSSDAAGASKPVTVLVADDQVAMRAGILRALESDGMRVVAEASNVTDAVAYARLYRPEVCLLATGIPGDAILAAEQMRDAAPDTKIVMLGEARDEAFVFRALRAGALGYLPDTTSAARLPHAIRGVAAGEAALPRTLTARVLREFRESGRGRRLTLAGRGDDIQLTEREFEVLQRLRQRQQTATIASHLQISEVTVRRHISAILRKLGVKDRRSALELLDSLEQPQPGTYAGPRVVTRPSAVVGDRS
jgi:DNA-binding NarL/FixJ family response regulator